MSSPTWLPCVAAIACRYGGRLHLGEGGRQEMASPRIPPARLPSLRDLAIQIIGGEGRGRNAGCPAPPAQIPACATNAPGALLMH